MRLNPVWYPSLWCLTADLPLGWSVKISGPGSLMLEVIDLDRYTAADAQLNEDGKLCVQVRSNYRPDPTDSGGLRWYGQFVASKPIRS